MDRIMHAQQRHPNKGVDSIILHDKVRRVHKHQNFFSAFCCLIFTIAEGIQDENPEVVNKADTTEGAVFQVLLVR